MKTLRNLFLLAVSLCVVAGCSSGPEPEGDMSAPPKGAEAATPGTASTGAPAPTPPAATPPSSD